MAALHFAAAEFRIPNWLKINPYRRRQRARFTNSSSQSGRKRAVSRVRCRHPKSCDTKTEIRRILNGILRRLAANLTWLLSLRRFESKGVMSGPMDGLAGWKISNRKRKVSYQPSQSRRYADALQVTENQWLTMLTCRGIQIAAASIQCFRQEA
jgi:hypothetical protein